MGGSLGGTDQNNINLQVFCMCHSEGLQVSHVQVLHVNMLTLSSTRRLQAAESEAAELPGLLLSPPAQLLPAPHPVLERGGRGRGGGPGPRGEPGH